MSALTDAWQAALAAEQQAVYGYGLLGPYLPTQPEIALAESCLAAHETLRDATSAAMLDAGIEPVDPAADYPDLYPVSVGRVALELAVRLEQQAAASWRFLYATASTSSGDSAAMLRTSAQAALTASAIRATQWRRLLTPTAATVAFPGI